MNQSEEESTNHIGGGKEVINQASSPDPGRDCDGGSCKNYIWDIPTLD